MAEPHSRRNSPITWLALAGLAVLLVWQVRKLLADPTVFPPDDFVEYWAAGKLNARGQDPYSEKLLHDLQRGETVRQETFAVMMWNPPWTLTFVMPFGLLPSRDAQLLWTLINLVVCLVCGDWLWRLYGGPVRLRWVSWLLTLTFMPTVFALGAGQIPPLILLGITAFLGFEKKGWPFLAGAAGVLIAIKPHLMLLFWIALAVWGCTRGWRVIVGGLVAGAIAIAIPLLCNPNVISQYREAMTNRPPAQWKSPTLGSLLREVVEDDFEAPVSIAAGGGGWVLFNQLPAGNQRGQTFALQFAPIALGLGFLAWYGWRRRNAKWDWLEQTPLLLLVSFVTASYGAWPYDVLILLPAVMHVAAGIARSECRRFAAWGIGAFVAFNLIALAMNVMQMGSHRFFWMGPALLVAYCVLVPHVPTTRDPAGRPLHEEAA